jgi:carbamoyltransferase
VRREDNAVYYDLLAAFERLTGCPLLVNTSFNVRGEPIVCTPEQAYACFQKTEMDVLVLEDFILLKDDSKRSALSDRITHQEEFQLD